MTLTDDGIEFHENVISAAECQELLDALRAVGRTRAGARHLMGVPMVHDYAEKLRHLAGNATPFRANAIR